MLALAAGCGRIGFGDHGDRDAAGGDDAPPVGAGTTYVKASNPDADDAFGYAIALSADGTTLAVGAPSESSSATGIDGDQADNSATRSGAVYVFVRTGATWVQQAYLKASNAEMFDLFGFAVALSGDGNTLAVSGYAESSAAAGIDGDQTDNSLGGAGAVYVFARAGGVWSQQSYIKASNPRADGFGYALSLAADGATLAVGAWIEPSGATGINGDQSDVTVDSAGAVYLFRRGQTTWAQEAYVKASNTDAGDIFGTSLAVSGDGSTLVVGAPAESSVAPGIDGNQADNSLTLAGAAYVFARAGAMWSQMAYVKASTPALGAQFGNAVAIDATGTTIAIGANLDNRAGASAGATYMFARAGGTWTETGVITAPNADVGDSFGMGLSLASGGALVTIGAPSEDGGVGGIDPVPGDNSVSSAGAVYAVERAGTAWTPRSLIKAPHPGDSDRFGKTALSADGRVLAVGADGESGASAGIDGDETDDSAPHAGAVYVFSE